MSSKAGRAHGEPINGMQGNFMKTRGARTLAATLGALLLSGCYVVKPRVVTAYDDDCEIGYRKMVLTVDQEPLFASSCSGAMCGEVALAALFVMPASAIVSGSIALVGNTVFWMEKRGRCDVQEASPTGVKAEAA